MIQLEPHVQGVVLLVRAHAGARQNAILGEREGALRVAVTAAPEKGKANSAIIALLSKMLGVSKSSIELIAGDTSPQKRFLIHGAEPKSLAATLSELLTD
ncbi:MAG: DUF167 domain-containing protein [Pirellulales bacterium]